MLVIVDYGMGNLRSVAKAFERIGVATLVSDDPSDIEKASSLVLPGVGHFGKAMDRLTSSGQREALENSVVGGGVPILGICLGMHLFMDRGDEGDAEGFGWLGGGTIRFAADRMSERLKIPHMGWNTLESSGAKALFADIAPDDPFYFVHSYHLDTGIDEEPTAASTEYGYRFVSAVAQGNVVGVQFHPEKSHRQGLRVLSNFVDGYCGWQS